MSELKVKKRVDPKLLVSDILGTDDWNYAEVVTESMLIDIAGTSMLDIAECIAAINLGHTITFVPQIGHLLHLRTGLSVAALSADNSRRAVDQIDEFFKAGKACKVWTYEGKWLIGPDLIQQDLEAKARIKAYDAAYYAYCQGDFEAEQVVTAFQKGWRRSEMDCARIIGFIKRKPPAYR